MLFEVARAAAARGARLQGGRGQGARPGRRGAVLDRTARHNARIPARTGAGPHRRSDESKMRGGIEGGRPAAAGCSSSGCSCPAAPAAGRPALPLTQGRAASARGARGHGRLRRGRPSAPLGAPLAPCPCAREARRSTALRRAPALLGQRYPRDLNMHCCIGLPGIASYIQRRKALTL